MGNAPLIAPSHLSEGRLSFALHTSIWFPLTLPTTFTNPFFKLFLVIPFEELLPVGILTDALRQSNSRDGVQSTRQAARLMI